MSSLPKVRRFVLKLARGRPLEDGESLWDTGAVDSLGLVQLVVFLEGELKRKLPARDVSPRTLDTIASIAAYLDARRG